MSRGLAEVFTSMLEYGDEVEQFRPNSKDLALIIANT
jgi:hypothetical protein